MSPPTLVARLLVTLLAGAVMAPQVAAAPTSANAEGVDAVGTPVIAAVPGSRASTYATPVVVIEPGDDLTFVNVEPFVHDVRSVAMGPDDTAWCNPPEASEPHHRVRNPRRFPIGKCPLLWTPPIAMTSGAVESKVYGTNNLRSGKSYEFYCTVFKNMRGTVVVR